MEQLGNFATNLVSVQPRLREAQEQRVQILVARSPTRPVLASCQSNRVSSTNSAPGEQPQQQPPEEEGLNPNDPPELPQHSQQPAPGEGESNEDKATQTRIVHADMEQMQQLCDLREERHLSGTRCCTWFRGFITCHSCAGREYSLLPATGNTRYTRRRGFSADPWYAACMPCLAPGATCGVCGGGNAIVSVTGYIAGILTALGFCLLFDCWLQHTPDVIAWSMVTLSNCGMILVNTVEWSSVTSASNRCPVGTMFLLSYGAMFAYTAWVVWGLAGQVHSGNFAGNERSPGVGTVGRFEACNHGFCCGVQNMYNALLLMGSASIMRFGPALARGLWQGGDDNPWLGNSTWTMSRSSSTHNNAATPCCSSQALIPLMIVSSMLIVAAVTLQLFATVSTLGTTTAALVPICYLVTYPCSILIRIALARNPSLSENWVLWACFLAGTTYVCVGLLPISLWHRNLLTTTQMWFSLASNVTMTGGLGIMGLVFETSMHG